MMSEMEVALSQGNGGWFGRCWSAFLVLSPKKRSTLEWWPSWPTTPPRRTVVLHRTGQPICPTGAGLPLSVTNSAPTTASEAAGEEELADLLLEVLPGDGSSLGNLSAREALSRVAERPISEEAYEEVKERLLAMGLIRKGRGRGADKLRAQMDAAEYKHLVLGLIFVKYISDTFAAHQAKVRQIAMTTPTPMCFGCPSRPAGRRCVPRPSSPILANGSIRPWSKGARGIALISCPTPL